MLFCFILLLSHRLISADIGSLQFISGWANFKILHKSKAFVVQSLIKWWIRISHSLFIFVGGSAFTEFPSLYLPLWSSDITSVAVPPSVKHPQKSIHLRIADGFSYISNPFFVINSFPPDYSVSLFASWMFSCTNHCFLLTVGYVSAVWATSTHDGCKLLAASGLSVVWSPLKYWGHAVWCGERAALEQSTQLSAPRVRVCSHRHSITHRADLTS